MASMISSVTARRAGPTAMARSRTATARSPKSMGSPNLTVILRIRGSRLPTGCTFSVPASATGTTSAPEVSASQATPGLPR